MIWNVIKNLGHFPKTFLASGHFCCEKFDQTRLNWLKIREKVGFWPKKWPSGQKWPEKWPRKICVLIHILGDFYVF